MGQVPRESNFLENHLYYYQDNIVAETFFESFEKEENDETEDQRSNNGSSCYSSTTDSQSCSSEELKSYTSDTFKNSTLHCNYSTPSIPTIPDSTKDITTSNCPICLQIYQEQCYLYPCYHTFCVSCIRQWLYITPDCPLCKYKVDFLITDVDDSKGTFSKLYIDDTMNNDKGKMKRQKWTNSEISNISEHNIVLRSIRNK